MQKPKLNARQIAFAREADRIHRKYSRKNVAARLGIGHHALQKYILGVSVSLEDWTERRKNLRGDVPHRLRDARGPSSFPHSRNPL